MGGIIWKITLDVMKQDHSIFLDHYALWLVMLIKKMNFG